MANGAFEELHQSTIPTRIAAPVDALWDAVGGITGVIIFLIFRLVSRRLLNKKELQDI